MAERPELSERKAGVLRALVRHYIRTGEPVGSEALSGTPGLRVSSATIRNDLASLEELGYLAQPHTSAGRMPTGQAYRFFVDSLPSRPRLREVERRAIVGFFDVALHDIDEILRGTTLLLSRLTHYASLALAPSMKEATIVRAELVSLGSGTLLLLVFDTGRVEKRLIEVPLESAPEDLERLSDTLARTLQGVTLGAAREAAAGLAEAAAGSARVVLERIAQGLRSVEEPGDDEHVFVGGVSNIAAADAFDRRETLWQVYETLERESSMLLLLREAAAAPDVAVTIGRENPLPGMWETSVVAAPYAAGSAMGTIGVVGPIRMDYSAAISAVRVVAERLSAAVEALRA